MTPKRKNQGPNRLPRQGDGFKIFQLYVRGEAA
jgi:hypothetical protein